MIHCAGSYGVRVNGQTVWFTDYTEAARVEAEALYSKVQKKLASGGTVIVTREMWKQVEAVQRSARNTALNQSAH